MQCAEKAIKAALMFEGDRFPKTQDLEALILLLPSTWGVAQQANDLSWLSHWSPNSRYPGDLDEGDRADADRAVAAAAATLGLASADLAARGVYPGP